MESTGDHHQIHLTLDPETKRVNAGVIANFSEHGAVGLNVVDGKVSGSLIHSGDTHSLRLDVENNGSFRGSYHDERGVDIEFDGNEATLKHGEIPAAGLTVHGDHHTLHLTRAADGKIAGSIESTDTKNNTFRLAIDDGRLTGSFTHSGDNHETEVKLGQNGWSANVSAGKGDLKWNLGIESGKVEKKVFAEVKLRF